jgi:hypothetical protein
VDVGTDVFAFKDDREEIARIQVKTNSNPTVYKDGSGHSAKFAISIKQLEQPDDRPALHYALAVRLKGKWVDFLVLGRSQLQQMWDSPQPFGSENATTGDLEITVEFRQEVTCSGRNLTAYRNAWDQLPPLRPSPKWAAQELGSSATGAGGDLPPTAPGRGAAPTPPGNKPSQP